MSHPVSAHPGLFGVMAEYADEHEIVHAAKMLYGLGYRKMDGYSPIPVHGLDTAIGLKRTKLPILILGAGICGMVGGFMLQAFTASTDWYAFNVGGRPYLSWPMFVPITFECTILLASLTAVFGMLGLNGLPQPYHPVFNVDAFVRCSRNGFFICVETTDPQFDLAKLKQDMESTDARAVYEVPE